MINTNPNMDVNMTVPILNTLHKRGALLDNRMAGGNGLQSQSIYGQPVIAAGGAAKKKRGPRKKKEVKPEIVEAKLEIEAKTDQPVAEVLGGKCKRKRKAKVAKVEGAAKKPNAWMAHLAAFRKAHPEVKPMQASKEAAKTYKK